MAQGLYLIKGGKQVKQNSGVTKKGNSNTDVTIKGINGKKIYPCEQSKNLPPSTGGGLKLVTYSAGYSGSMTGKAMQGYYTGPTGSPRERIGIMYWANGKPKVKNLIRVDRVRLEIYRNVNTGWYNNNIIGTLRFNNVTSDNSSFNTAKSNVQGDKFEFTWLKGGKTTVIDNNSKLNTFMYNFLKSGCKSLCLYNGENSPDKPYGSDQMSTNYAGTKNVYIEMWVTYEP